MNSPLPYDVMSIVYKQLSIEDKSNLIDALLIFQIWFSADLIRELFCKSGCVRCVPDGHTELRLLSPDADVDNFILCSMCNLYNDYMPYCLAGIMCVLCSGDAVYCLKCTIANDDLKMCEDCRRVILYNKKCAIHYDPLVTRCNNC
jgi:hypothetical protein